MYEEFLKPITDNLGVSQEVAAVILSVIVIWSLIWKGLALWKASKKNQLTWFVILLVVNTIGILEILYIYVFSEMNFETKQKEIKDKKLKKKTKKRK
jgi:hypothetical protein